MSQQYCVSKYCLQLSNFGKKIYRKKCSQIFFNLQSQGRLHKMFSKMPLTFAVQFFEVDIQKYFNLQGLCNIILSWNLHCRKTSNL